MFRYRGILNSDRLIFTSVEGVSEILQRHYEFIQPEQVKMFAEPAIGPGLVLVNGEEHKKQRRELMPSFSMRHIRELHPVFWGKAVEMTRKFEQLIDEAGAASGFSAPILIDHWVGLSALDVISKAALGVDFGSIAHPESELVSSYRRVFEPTTFWAVVGFLKLVFPARLVESVPVQEGKDALAAVKLLRERCARSVAEKKALLARGELDTNDIISALVRDRHVAEDGDLITHMLMMLGAGHETVSVGLIWCMYEFCRHPEWQRAVRAEVRAAMPSPDSDVVPSPDTIDPETCPLLNAFLHECLRYWPPIPQIVRAAAVDTAIAGVPVPRNTKLQLSIVGFNRDEQNWGPDAAVFRPERWLRDDAASGRRLFEPKGGATSKYSFMTFIHGPRDCPGRVFSRHEMLAALACWIGRFDWVLTDQDQMDEKNVAVAGGSFSAKPVHGIYIHARRAPGW